MSAAIEGEEVSLSERIQGLNNIDELKLKEAIRQSRDIAIYSDPNILYQKCFQILRLGGLEAEIPRLVVFGQQSMGKTTLLDMIMGGPIGYSSTDTGTKMPVVIMLRPSKDGSLQCHLSGKSMPMKDLEQRMKEIMKSTELISEEELELEISLPGGVHAVFVDLPGIKDDSKEGAEITRNVVRNYVQNNPNDLYILVKKASDDPGNWPYLLREFILSARPHGLGLTPKQTMVVGTRAKDFLIGEKNDIRTQAQLFERVKKRSINDSRGEALPLYLMELFSLTIEQKETLDFFKRKRAMEKQISEGRTQCLELLHRNFERGRQNTAAFLEKTFDSNVFRKDLAEKFNQLLNDQLEVLERRLTQKKTDLESQQMRVTHDITEQGSWTYRESIKSFVREFTHIVTEMITGNYQIFSLGEEFLERHGGSLEDNLQEGNDLAANLFPGYKKELLEQMLQLGERAVKKLNMRATDRRIQIKKEAQHRRFQFRKKSKRDSQERKQDGDQDGKLEIQDRKQEPSSDDDGQSEADSDSLLRCGSPRPDVSGSVIPGQFVRYSLNKEDSYMLGFVRELSRNQVESNLADLKAIKVAFTYKGPNASEANTTQDRPVDGTKLGIVIPLGLAPNLNCSDNTNFLAWHRKMRSDGWTGLEAVQITSIKAVKPMANPWLDNVVLGNGTRTSQLSTVIEGTVDAFRVRVKDLKGPLSWGKFVDDTPGAALADKDTDKYNVDKSEQLGLSISELFIDAEMFNAAGQPWSQTALQRIAGTFADKRLLNQFSLTSIGKWLQFLVVHLEANHRVPDNVALQMMRSAPGVMDVAHWEPLVADLLKTNIEKELLPLTELTAAAASVALRRILQVAIDIICDKVKVEVAERGDSLFGPLLQSKQFMSELSRALDEHCHGQARRCAAEMKHLIIDQTQGIHFDSIVQIFEGCREFEATFLAGLTMNDVAEKVRNSIAGRKTGLAAADVFANMGPPGENIFSEVRVHFWVLKILVPAPLATKLYIYFVKGLRGGSLLKKTYSTSTAENTMENGLLKELLNDRPLGGLGDGTTRSEQELARYFNLDTDREDLSEKLNGLRRALEYVNITRESISRLRTMMAQKGGVDFLTQIEKSMSVKKEDPHLPPPPPPPQTDQVSTVSSPGSGTAPWDTAA